MTRAKFRCDSVEHHNGGNRVSKFSAVSDDGIPEHERYHKYTPAGSIQITVDNPAVEFTPGSLYYVDFTPAE